MFSVISRDFEVFHVFVVEIFQIEGCEIALGVGVAFALLTDGGKIRLLLFLDSFGNFFANEDCKIALGLCLTVGRFAVPGFVGTRGTLALVAVAGAIGSFIFLASF